jgi:hypothetical protein
MMPNPFGGAPNMLEGPLQAVPAPGEFGVQNMINNMFRRATDFYMKNPMDPFGNTSVFRKDGFDSVLRELRFAVIGVYREKSHPVNVEIFPTRITDATVIHTEYVEYIPIMPRMVPEGGVGPLQQQRRHSSTTRLELHKLNFEISREFESTQIGQWNVAENVIQLAQNFIRYHAHMAVAALMIPNYQDNGLNGREIMRQDLCKMIIRKRDRAWACHKWDNGLPRLLQMYSDEIFDRCGVRPTHALVPRGRKNLIRSMQSMTSAAIAGPDGPNRLLGDGADYLLIDGIKVMEIPEVPARFRKEETQLSSYPVTGEFIHLNIEPDQNPDGDLAWRMYNQFKDGGSWLAHKAAVEASVCFIKWNADAARHHRMAANRIAFENARAEAVDGDMYQINWYAIRKISAFFHMEDKEIFQTLHGFKAALVTVPEGFEDGFLQEYAQDNRIIAVPGVAAPGEDVMPGVRRPRVQEDHLLAATALGVTFTLKEIARVFSFMAYRFLYFRSEDGVLAVGGEETGETLLNVGELIRSSDGPSGMDIVTCSEMAGIHVANPNRFQRIPDMTYAGILGGGNATPLRHSYVWEENGMQKETFTELRAFKEAGFRQERGDLAKPSVFIMPIPLNEVIEDRPFHFTNGFFPDQSAQHDTPSWGGAFWFGKYMGFHKTEKYVECRNEPRTGNLEPPLVVFRGQKGYVDKYGHLVVIEGETHHGPWEENGAQRIRDRGERQYPVTKM